MSLDHSGRLASVGRVRSGRSASRQRRCWRLPGDPLWLVHRESTPADEPSESFVIRADGEAPPTIEVDEPSS
jgi:hypothetical protein